MKQVTFPTLERDVYALHQQIEELMGGRGVNKYIWGAEPIGNQMYAITIRADELPAALQRFETRVRTDFAEGNEVRFSLIAQCAIRRGEKNNRLPIDMDDDERRLEWLHRRAEPNGFAVIAADIASVERIRIAKAGARHLADRTRFDGRLKVTNPTKFAGAIRHGIGHGKAFGLGLIDTH